MNATTAATNGRPKPTPPLFDLIAIDSIDESSTNPRKTFDKKELDELAEDIKIHGVLQPVLVRPRGVRYELVFGTRRLRAARAAGLKIIPSTVRELDDATALELQIVENAKRADIHPLEEAEAYE